MNLKVGDELKGGQYSESESSQSCLTLWPLGILQARIQEWVAIPFSRGSCWPRDWTWVSYIADRLFWAIQLSLVQSLSHVWLFVISWITACQACLSITNSWSSLKLMPIESVLLSSHLILCRPLLLLPPVPPRISLFQWVNSSHKVAKVLEFQL